MSAARNDLTITVAGYLALEAASPDIRYEYLDGQIVMMSGGSRNHSLISSNITIFLGQALRNSACLVFNSDARVKLSDTRYVYPDVSVSCAAQRDDEQQNVTEPTVVVEVLSPGTIAYDRGDKLQRYRDCPSLQAILLVFQDQILIEVYRRQGEKIWMIQTYGIDEQIVLDTIGVTMPVAEIYRRVTFTI
jgi:Uma2 family endonuclease